jgi:hypothetical protein
MRQQQITVAEATRSGVGRSEAAAERGGVWFGWIERRREWGLRKNGQ